MKKINFLILTLTILTLISAYNASADTYILQRWNNATPFNSGTQQGFSYQTTSAINISNVSIMCGMSSGSTTIGLTIFMNNTISGDTITPNINMTSKTANIPCTTTWGYITFDLPTELKVIGNSILNTTFATYYFEFNSGTSFRINRSAASSFGDSFANYYDSRGLGAQGYETTYKIYSVDKTGTSPPPEPTVDSPSPANNTRNNTQVQINFTCVSGLNYYLYFDNTTSPSTAVISNSSTHLYNTSVVSNSDYYYRASCYNATSNLQANTSVYKWSYDTSIPTISLNSNNEFNTSGTSFRNQYDNELSLNISFGDNLALYAYEINVTKGGIVFYNETNTTMSGTSATITRQIPVNTWDSGLYDIRIWVSDSHTAELIGDYKPIQANNLLEFSTEADNKISISSEDSSTATATKQMDRYNFDFSFTDGKTTDRTFDLITDKCPLTYLPDSPYKAHFVSLCINEMKGNWIDFEGETGTPIVNKIDDYHYTIYFSNLDSKVQFNSIGGLNIYEANYTWYKGNLTFTNTTGIVNEKYNFNLNMTNASSLITGINATFTYNGVSYTTQRNYSNAGFVYFNVTITMPSTATLSNFTWNITIIEDTTNYNYLLNSSQNVVSFNIINCSSSNGTNPYTFTLYYKDENTPANSLTSNLQAYLEFSPNKDFTNKKNHTAILSPATNHSFCINPTDIPIYVDGWFEYNNSNGFIHRYYLRNLTANSTMQSFNLYNVNDANILGNITTSTNTVSNTSTTFTYSSGYSILKLTTRQLSNYNYYRNVITQLQRFYTGEGTWRTIQMDESGDYGLLNFDILERNVEYRMIFIDRNSTGVLKTTQPMKFVCTNKVCDLIYLLDINAITSTSSTISYNWSLDNTSSMFSFNWSQNSGVTKTVRFYVTKTTITGTQDICDTTQSGQAGIVSCNASLYTGNVFVSVYEDGSLLNGEWQTLPSTSLSSFLPTGEGAFWAVMIMVICIMFGLFSPVGSIITGVIGLIIIYLLGIFNPLTFAGLITAIIIGTVIGFKVRA